MCPSASSAEHIRWRPYIVDDKFRNIPAEKFSKKYTFRSTTITRNRTNSITSRKRIMRFVAYIIFGTYDSIALFHNNIMPLKTFEFQALASCLFPRYKQHVRIKHHPNMITFCHKYRCYTKTTRRFLPTDMCDRTFFVSRFIQRTCYYDRGDCDDRKHNHYYRAIVMPRFGVIRFVQIKFLSTWLRSAAPKPLSYESI
jgi:hypothetical protein